MTTAGGINSTEIISLIAIGFSLATLAVVRIKRRRPMKPRDYGTDRDCFTDSLLVFHSTGGRRD
jgi:hypothetical protein